MLMHSEERSCEAEKVARSRRSAFGKVASPDAVRQNIHYHAAIRASPPPSLWRYRYVYKLLMAQCCRFDSSDISLHLHNGGSHKELLRSESQHQGQYVLNVTVQPLPNQTK